MSFQPLTIKQAASYCNMKEGAFRYYIDNGRGPEPLMIGERKCFLPDTLKNWKPVKKPRGGYKGKKNES